MEWELKSNKLMTSVNNFIGGQTKRKISTNSHIGRDGLSSAFKHYDSKGNSNERNDKQITKESPLLKGK